MRWSSFVMARRTIIRRRRVIIYVVALWWNLLQQAIWLLMDSTTNRTTFADDENEVPRPLSYDREVYRHRFMFNTTGASDVNCISMYVCAVVSSGSCAEY
ncbi:hypothetical protein LINPERPRIM_LOCUS29901 [Linum perenne]